VNGDKVAKQFITSEWSYDGFSYVREGLVGGEVLVDKGSRSVQEQEQVKVVQ